MPPSRSIEAEAADGRQLTLGEVRAWLAACYDLPDATPVSGRVAVAFNPRPPLRLLSAQA